MASILYHLKSEKSIVVILLLMGLAGHFAFFGTPPSAVFDEVHFGKFITAYFTGEYYFDIHPPLGKLILAGWGGLWGFEPGFSFANIGDAYPDNLYLALRFLPALAGALVPLALYGVARRLGMSIPAAFLAGAFIALDNALLVQSRFILLDSFLLLFGFSAIYCYLTWRQGGALGWLLAGGILAGMAAGIKWTGLAFLGIIIVLELIRLWKDRRGTAQRRLVPVLACLVLAPLAVYYAAFSIHFALLPKSGAGDAFMSPGFQSTLVGNRWYGDPAVTDQPSAVGKFLELNEEMYQSNQRLTAHHPYASDWYTWPFMNRAIFYWVQDAARIYLLGNPVVWWGSTIAVAGVLAVVLLSGMRKTDPTALLLLGAWLLNLLPFIGIGRVMFLYHYLPALAWAVLMLAWLIDRTRRPWRWSLALTGLALAGFLFFAPLSYGLNLTPDAYDARVWFSTWR